MTIHPDFAVKGQAEMNTVVISNGRTDCYAKGDEMIVNKGVSGQCAEPIILDGGKVCVDQTWFVTVPAGGAWKAEVPADVCASALEINTCGCLAYAFGTAENPLAVPEALAEVKENAPELLQPGEHVLPMSDGGCPVNAIALINCGADDIKTQVTWRC